MSAETEEQRSACRRVGIRRAAQEGPWTCCSVSPFFFLGEFLLDEGGLSLDPGLATGAGELALGALIRAAARPTPRREATDKTWRRWRPPGKRLPLWSDVGLAAPSRNPVL